MLVTFKPLKSGRYLCNQTKQKVSKREIDWYRNYLIKFGTAPGKITAPTYGKRARPSRPSSAFRRKHSS